MSRENVEVVRRLYEAYNAGDLSPPSVRCATPTWSCTTLKVGPEPGPSVGREAVLREIEQLREAFAGDTLEPSTGSHAASP